MAILYLSALGLGIRMALSSLYGEQLMQRIEIATPVNSWERMREGSFLHKHKLSPYDGDLFHGTPLMLLLGNWLLQFDTFLLPLVFAIVDVLVSWLFYAIGKCLAQELLEREHQNKKHHEDSAKNLLLNPNDIGSLPLKLAACFIFNPYIIANCVGQTTTTFFNLYLALCILCMLTEKVVLSLALLALCTYESFYSISLIVPMSMYLARKKYPKDFSYLKPSVQQFLMRSLFVFSISLTALFFASKELSGSWDFLSSTYGFVWNVPDLKPNIGLFWYFFTEMFEHFRVLFVCTFQINAFLYVVPLSIRFHRDPILIFYCLMSLTALFKSYPSVGDVGFYLSFLPMWSHLYPLMRQPLVIGCFFLATSVLAPIMWHLWIYQGSANANFFFGITLGFAVAQIFLITDILFAYIKREHHLCHGSKNEVDGKPATLSLK
ncbi:unnamed protein product [Darwinula stevensoni]|uniref:Phosphatidylinositol glycan anchor biosynthesis class U protein n=1 Tax=Darwinula stevensoni TaxID=69355 RepID=A0A7R9FN27_9CRUS|nr:unnamed protein product [Darwinula stevensoni]CAG0896199.1 unnamed protein product [Darwinula stevensoni]